MYNSFWKHGQKKRLAELAGISATHLTAILNRRRNAGVDVAIRLQKASFGVVQGGIDFSVWVSAQYTKHPAFIGKPKKSSSIFA